MEESKPAPFQRGICESQINEPGITGNFTIDAMQLVVDTVGCYTSSLHSLDTVKCLRDSDMETLLNASIVTHSVDIARNIGAIWLPVVDGNFLPAAPSQLIKEGRFANITTVIGWYENNLTMYTNTTISTDEQVHESVQGYVPTMTSANVDKLLYPTFDSGLQFQAQRGRKQIKSVLLRCAGLPRHPNVSDQVIKGLDNDTGYGVIHTSHLEYAFGNLPVFDSGENPFQPTPADYALASRGSRSWSTFASTGKLSLKGHVTFLGFTTAFPGSDETDVFIAGGPHDGLSPIAGPKAQTMLNAQRLRERCVHLLG